MMGGVNLGDGVLIQCMWGPGLNLYHKIKEAIKQVFLLIPFSPPKAPSRMGSR